MQFLKPGLSRKFILPVAAVFLFLIALMAFSFRYMAAETSELLRTILMKGEDEVALERTAMVMERLKGGRFRHVPDVIDGLRRAASADASLLHVLVFSRTADDEYHRIIEKIRLNAAFEVDAEVKSEVALERNNRYLKRGVYVPVADPWIHASGAFTWRNVYHPFNFGRKNLVVCFMVSAGRTSAALAEYDESMGRIRRNALIINSAAALAVLAALALFTQNFRFFLSKLSAHIARASRGDLAVNISAPEGDELQELASSFNSLVEEMRVLKKREKQYADKDPLDELFKSGVEVLKEGRLDDAVTLFRALGFLRPESFGSYFNLGVAYVKMRRYGDSLEMFNKALAVNPGHALAREYAEKVSLMKERYDRGVDENSGQA